MPLLCALSLCYNKLNKPNFVGPRAQSWWSLAGEVQHPKRLSHFFCYHKQPTYSFKHVYVSVTNLLVTWHVARVSRGSEVDVLRNTTWALITAEFCPCMYMKQTSLSGNHPYWKRLTAQCLCFRVGLAACRPQGGLSSLAPSSPSSWLAQILSHLLSSLVARASHGTSPVFTVGRDYKVLGQTVWIQGGH